MALTLEFQRTGVVPSTADGPIRMSGPSLTLGRGEANDVVLPDPDRFLSKTHCVIEDRGGAYVVIDLSTNGTFLNYGKQPLGRVATPINDGDVLSLGGFELMVGIGSAQVAAAADPFDIPPPLDEAPRPSAETATPGRPETLDDDDFLDEFLGGTPSSKAAEGLIPDDPFDDDPGIGGGKGYIPNDFDLGLETPDSNERHHRSGAADAFTPRAVHTPQIPDDDADFGAPEETPVVDPLTRAKTRPVEPTEPTLPPSAQTAAVENTDAARAFLKSADVEHLDIDDADLTETMERLGDVFQTLVTGIRELLMTRAAMKNEFRMERTTISAAGNNPLKFSMSAEQALELMTKAQQKGYLAPRDAAEEALKDIKAHEVAILTGMQSALHDILARLDPKSLEDKIVTSGGLASLLKGRKAQYWEVYEKLYSEIAEQAEEDFLEVFGKAFAKAYAKQIENFSTPGAGKRRKADE